MTRLFDGIGSLTADTFGAAVSVTVPAGVAAEVVAAFREEPVEVLDQDGRSVTTIIPTLRGPKDRIGDLPVGSVVVPGNGKTYRVVAPIRTRSPAHDSHLIVQLELDDASG